jgi:membrane protease YdiL (CAAX protease family)
MYHRSRQYARAPAQAARVRWKLWQAPVRALSLLERLPMSRSQERHETFPNIIEAFFLVVALFGLEYLVAAAFRDAGYLRQYDARSVEAVVQHSVAATLGTLSLPILLLVPGLLLAMSAVESALAWLVPLSRAEEAMFERMMSSGLVTIVTVCILAPVLEEMLFRGVILRSFLHQYPRHVAIFASAAVFGFAHLNIYQFVAGLALGALAGWLYERARSLLPCILLHASYNSLVTYWYFAGQNPPQGLSPELPLTYWFAAAAAAFAGTTMLRRMLNERT